jgi:hypothetical protein
MKKLLLPILTCTGILLADEVKLSFDQDFDQAGYQNQHAAVEYYSGNWESFWTVRLGQNQSSLDSMSAGILDYSHAYQNIELGYGGMFGNFWLSGSLFTQGLSPLQPGARFTAACPIQLENSKYTPEFSGHYGVMEDAPLAFRLGMTQWLASTRQKLEFKNNIQIIAEASYTARSSATLNDSTFLEITDTLYIPASNQVSAALYGWKEFSYGVLGASASYANSSLNTNITTTSSEEDFSYTYSSFPFDAPLHQYQLYLIAGPAVSWKSGKASLKANIPLWSSEMRQWEYETSYVKNGAPLSLKLEFNISPFSQLELNTSYSYQMDPWDKRKYTGNEAYHSQAFTLLLNWKL